ncbi:MULTISPECIES: glycosyltransferase family 4 protein [Bacteria]|uniref:glycosyltransferase family 4 protein n=1 Tax=Bacteria TaxID=2 RepID=UPI003C7B3688
MERASWDLTVALGHSEDVSVLTTPVPGHGESFVADGIPVRTIRGAKSGKYSPRWWLATARTRTDGYDAVLSVSAGATAMILLGRKGPRYVFQAHGTAKRELQATLRGKPSLWPLRALRYAWWMMIDRFSYRRSTVVGIGPAVIDALKDPAYAGAFRENGPTEIPNGVGAPPPRLDPPSDRDRPVLLAAARLTAQKGVDRVIAALPAGRGSLTVLGDGPELAALARLAADSGVESRVTFSGHVDAEAVRKAMACADAFVFLPRNIEREGLPMVVLEALAAGLPIVTLDGGLWPADIRDQLTIVRDATPAAVAEAIAAVDDLPRTALPERYRMENVVARYRELFGELDARPAEGTRA